MPTEHRATAAEAYRQHGVTQGATEKWAICCSGGGIRSAAYCLGALQRLDEANFLDKARLILGVSGGSYISASWALVARGLELNSDTAGPAAYAPGSPEEEHLRDNTRYLVPDAKTLLAGVLTVLFGVAVTLALST
jgi:Patatin-like phospholipase